VPNLNPLQQEVSVQFVTVTLRMTGTVSPSGFSVFRQIA